MVCFPRAVVVAEGDGGYGHRCVITVVIILLSSKAGVLALVIMSSSRVVVVALSLRWSSLTVMVVWSMSMSLSLFIVVGQPLLVVLGVAMQAMGAL